MYNDLKFKADISFIVVVLGRHGYKLYIWLQYSMIWGLGTLLLLIRRNAFCTRLKSTTELCYLQVIPRNMHTVLLCFALLRLCNRSQWIHMKYLSIFIRVALLALGQSLDCHSASEVSLMDMGNQSMYNHNKAQQSKNRVYISWDILYYGFSLWQQNIIRFFPKCSQRSQCGLTIKPQESNWNSTSFS